jgi:hypothetical protein
MYSFKDFVAVNYKPGQPDIIGYQAVKRKKELAGSDVAETEDPEKSPDLKDKEVVVDAPVAANAEVNAPEGDDPKKAGELEEVLSPAQRMKARARLRRSKARIRLGAKRQSKRIATPARLKRRAQRQARNLAMKKILRGKSKRKLSFAARASIERMVNRRKPMIAQMARRLLPKVRAKDRSKFRRAAASKK